MSGNLRKPSYDSPMIKSTRLTQVQKNHRVNQKAIMLTKHALNNIDSLKHEESKSSLVCIKSE